MAQKPVFTGKHTIFHGFGRSANETAPGHLPFTWWGSDAYPLPEGTQIRFLIGEDCRVAEIEDRAYRGVRAYAVDPVRAKALWAKSEEIVGECFPE